ncbi:MAG: hypothetical protein DMG24_23370, partial [Acidobacteria bacterium]
MSDLKKLRHTFKPARITTLFVGESPQVNGTFFYKTDSVLYREMKRAFSGGDDFLQEFRSKCFFLDDLVLNPINKAEGKERTEHRRNGVPLLAARMRRYKPAAVVVLMKAIEPMVRKAMYEAGLSSTIPFYVVPFPAMGNAKRFRDVMAQIIPTLPVCKPPSPRSTDQGQRTKDKGQRTAKPEPPPHEFTPLIEVSIAGIHFQNPVLTASGTFGYGQEFA